MRKRAKQLRKKGREKKNRGKLLKTPEAKRREHIALITRLPGEQKELLMKKMYTALEAERGPLLERMKKTSSGEKRTQMVTRLTEISQRQRILEATYMAEIPFSEKTAAVIFEFFGIKWREELK